MGAARRSHRAGVPSAAAGSRRCNVHVDDPWEGAPVRATLNRHVQLTGTGSCVGDHAVSNVELAGLISGYDASRSGPFAPWVDQVTHIHERPFTSARVPTSTLALAAARKALEQARLAPTDLGMIVYASFTMSHMIPGDHCVFAHELGASRTPTFHLMGACAGSIYGLGLAYGMVASGAMKHVLVVGAETIAPQLNFADPLTAILFADGAGAAIVSRNEDGSPGTGMLPPHMGFEFSDSAIRIGRATDGKNRRCFDPAISPDDTPFAPLDRTYIEMGGGPSVLRNAVNNMAECTVRTLGYEMSDLRGGNAELRATLDRARLVPHQANGRIVDGLCDKLSMRPERVTRTVYRYGNMSAASNLVALDFAMREGNMERMLDADGKVLGVRTTPERIRRGDLVLLPSIGGGYLMGCIGLGVGYEM